MSWIMFVGAMFCLILISQVQENDHYFGTVGAFSGILKACGNNVAGYVDKGKCMKLLNALN